MGITFKASNYSFSSCIQGAIPAMRNNIRPSYHPVQPSKRPFLGPIPVLYPMVPMFLSFFFIFLIQNTSHSMLILVFSPILTNLTIPTTPIPLGRNTGLFKTPHFTILSFFYACGLGNSYPQTPWQQCFQTLLPCSKASIEHYPACYQLSTFPAMQSRPL